LARKISKNLLIGDVSSNRTYSIGTYLVLCLVSTVMTVMNIYTNKGFLTISTAIFAVACVINVIFTFVSISTAKAAKVLFALEVIVMFCFFLISGNPDGFSAIWICMLPSLGMFFFNRVRGSIICGVMFCALAFFLWTPYGNTFLMYNYTDTFKMRFPVLFIAFHLLAFLLETLRMSAFKETIRLQEYYQDLSNRDQLTRVLNRQGFYYSLKKNENYMSGRTIYVAMFDIDDFKKINDMYGHRVGDSVLIETTEIITRELNATFCRWGGEEFIAVFTEDTFSSTAIERVRVKVNEKEFASEDGREKFNISISVGVSEKCDYSNQDIDILTSNADTALYSAKAAGKNRVVYFKQLDIKQ